MIKKYVQTIISCILNIINRIMPKDDNKIFFFDYRLIAFNEIALIKYLHENNFLEHHHVIYFTREVKAAKRKYGHYRNISFTRNIFSGIYHRVTAKYCFAEFVNYIFTCRPMKKQICMSLWHGLALKKIGYESNHKLKPYISDTFSYMLCYSRFAADIMKRSFHFNEDKVLISQNPRDDLMFSVKDCLSALGIEKIKKTILWLPTFRKSDLSQFYDSAIDFPLIDKSSILYIDEYLKKKNMNLIIKLHPLQRSIDFLQGTYNNVYIIETKDFHKVDCEFYELIGQSDALLSDYSSVAFDYMLLDRPIGYVIDDIESYNRGRGFNVEDPQKFMPGHHIFDLNGLFLFFDDIASGNDPYRNERNIVNNTINQFKDPNNCRRVLEKIGIISIEDGIDA